VHSSIFCFKVSACFLKIDDVLTGHTSDLFILLAAPNSFYCCQWTVSSVSRWIASTQHKLFQFGDNCLLARGAIQKGTLQLLYTNLLFWSNYKTIKYGAVWQFIPNWKKNFKSSGDLGGWKVTISSDVQNDCDGRLGWVTVDKWRRVDIGSGVGVGVFEGRRRSRRRRRQVTWRYDIVATA
jgi:hypothetical protein